MTNNWQGKPSGVPLGIRRCWGHPQPQKLKMSSSSPPVGRLASKSRKVLSNGTVTEDSVDFLVMVLLPWRTEQDKRCQNVFQIALDSLTSHPEPIQFYEHQSLSVERPGVASFVGGGCQKDPAGPLGDVISSIHNGNVVSERFVVQMSEADENRTAFLEIDPTWHIYVWLLPERSESILWHVGGD